MIIETISDWDEKFFQRIIDFKAKMQSEIATNFPETIEDYSRFFGESSFFKSDYLWKAFLVIKDGQVMAKAILCHQRNNNTGNLGFIDWINDEAVAKFLIGHVLEYAKAASLIKIKTPVDLNLFVKYRIKISGGEPFYGEPIYPDYYHQLFKITGFNVVGEWDTYRLSKISGIIDFFEKRVKLTQKKDGSHSRTKSKDLRTTIRCVNLENWDEKLQIIHCLFNEAYRDMPEFETVTFDQFKVIYDDFKYIINPLYSYIVELQGKPVGFSINYVDPLPILAPLKNKKLNFMQKALVFAKLRLNRGTLLIAHVGKVPGPNGEEIKGVQIQVSNRISAYGWLMKKVLVTFQNINSPSRRTFNPKIQTEYAKYVLYGRDI